MVRFLGGCAVQKPQLLPRGKPQQSSFGNYSLNPHHVGNRPTINGEYLASFRWRTQAKPYVIYRTACQTACSGGSWYTLCG